MNLRTDEAKATPTRPLQPLWFSLLAVLVGIVAGLGAVAFRGLIGLFHNLLFLGATLGGAYGMALGWLFPQLSISPPAFAVAGMAGVVGGATGAAMAAIGKIVEKNYLAVGEQTVLFDVITGMRASGASIALVLNGSGPVSLDRVQGLISRRQLADAMVEAAELFQD